MNWLCMAQDKTIVKHVVGIIPTWYDEENNL